MAPFEPSAEATRLNPVHDDTPEHVSRCPACWERLAARHRERHGTPPPRADDMAALFGCDAVRERLPLLAGVAIDDIPVAFPAVARHLRWCAACHDAATELLAAAAEAAAPAARPAAAWSIAPRPGSDEVFVELDDDFVARVGRGRARFDAVPGQATFTAVAAPVGAPRGSQTGAVAVGRQLALPLSDSGLAAHLAVDPFGTEAMRLELAVSGEVRGPMSVKVFAAADGDLALLGAAPLDPRRSATFRGILPGRYLVEIHERARRRRFRLRLLVQSPA